MTYSIVARDPGTGRLGVAVQSHWFSVGSVVTWGEAGVGVVATQALAEIAHGPRGLELMRNGMGAAAALRESLAKDAQPEVRQVAMLDARGTVATHTGERCIGEAGHATGEQASAQANMMRNATVWAAMMDGFSRARGDLAERLLIALEAAERAGGDIRGRQSAAMLIVSGEATGDASRDRVLELRVEDHAEPLAELRRLVGVHRGYDAMNRADERLGTGDLPGAGTLYDEAQRALGDNLEAAFWAGLALGAAGELDAARARLGAVFARDDSWRELLRRLPRSGLAEPQLVEDLLR